VLQHIGKYRLDSFAVGAGYVRPLIDHEPQQALPLRSAYDARFVMVDANPSSIAIAAASASSSTLLAGLRALSVPASCSRACRRPTVAETCERPSRLEPTCASPRHMSARTCWHNRGRHSPQARMHAYR
jgi:hypothetical protein